MEWSGILQGWLEFTRGSPVFISGMIAINMKLYSVDFESELRGSENGP